MDGNFLKDLNLDKFFLSFLEEMNSPVIICDSGFTLKWFNPAYKANSKSLPDVEALDKQKFKKIFTNGEIKGYIYHYEVNISSQVKSIAHDFNNILSTIINSAEALKLKLNEEEHLLSYIRIIENNAHLASEITDSLLPNKKTIDKRKKVNSKKLINEIVEAVNQTFPEEITIEELVDEFSPDIICNQADIYRSLLNICINAKEAINGVGKITLALKKHSDKDLEISISDTGTGVEETKLQKIFEKGYSTKNKNRESGLGLNIVKEIITKHSGSISAESVLGKGTTFKILLPYVNELPKSKSENKISKILLADDEEILRELLAELLESNGFEVFQAGDGIETIELYKKENPDLLIVDRKMPNLSGLDCIEKIRELNLTVPVILASGSQPEEHMKRIKELNINGILSKPYDFDQMKLIIDEISN